MPADDDDTRDVLAGLSFYTGRSSSGLLRSFLPRRNDAGAAGGPHRTRPQHIGDVGGGAAQLRRLGRSLRERADEQGITQLTRDDPGWPSDKDIDAPCLWVRGDVNLTSRLARAVTITGTRASSDDGHAAAAALAGSLAATGLTIVTGLSAGIAAAAAATAFDTPTPPLLVAPAGLDQPSHPVLSPLAQRATATSALISAFPPGCPPSTGRWNYRFALLGQLSAATVLVEVPSASRALLTASAALELGRLVCVAPGPNAHGTWSGGHRLVIEGVARPVATAADVLACLRDAAQSGNAAAAAVFVAANGEKGRR
jgi:DNA processing protein